jgi:hypothetical protein
MAGLTEYLTALDTRGDIGDSAFVYIIKNLSFVISLIILSYDQKKTLIMHCKFFFFKNLVNLWPYPFNSYMWTFNEIDIVYIENVLGNCRKIILHIILITCHNIHAASLL